MDLQAIIHSLILSIKSPVNIRHVRRGTLTTSCNFLQAHIERENIVAETLSPRDYQEVRKLYALYSNK